MLSSIVPHLACARQQNPAYWGHSCCFNVLDKWATCGKNKTLVARYMWWHDDIYKHGVSNCEHLACHSLVHILFLCLYEKYDEGNYFLNPKPAFLIF